MKHQSQQSRISLAEASDLSTDELVELIRDGRTECFEHVIRRYQLDISRIVHAMLLERSVAEDIVQSVFLKAFFKLEQYRIGASFAQWLRGIARNTVNQELRSRYREQGRMKAYASLVMARLDRSDDDSLVESERQRALRECVDQLDGNAKTIIRRRYVDSDSYDKIAASLGRKAGAIRTMVYRLRNQLQKCLESKGVFE